MGTPVYIIKNGKICHFLEYKLIKYKRLHAGTKITLNLQERITILNGPISHDRNQDKQVRDKMCVLYTACFFVALSSSCETWERKGSGTILVGKDQVTM